MMRKIGLRAALALASLVAFLLTAAEIHADELAGGGGLVGVLVRMERFLAQIEREATLLLTDGIAHGTLGLLFFAPILLRQLRELPRAYTLGLIAITVVAAMMRAFLSEPTLLDAWPYSRITSVARLIYEGPVVRALGGTYYLTDILFDSNLAMSILTPCAIFAHARYLFADPRIAIAAAGLLAILPNHIRFARSDVAFVQLVLFSCLSFIALHQALGDSSRRRRVVSMALLPIISVAAFDSRPLACNLGPLLIAAAWLFVPPDVPRRRRIVATVLVLLAMAYDIQFHLLARHGSQVQEGLAFATFVRGFLGMFSGYNTLLLPRVTPLGLTALAFVGLAVLVRSGEPKKALFLLAWLVGFYLSLGFVLSPITDMQARYHLHLVEPFVQLAAVGLVAALSWRRWAGVALAVYAVMSPFIHMGFVRDVKYSLPAEFTLLTTFRDRIPAGCTVLEYAGPEPGVPGDPLHLARISEAVTGEGRGWRWNVISTGAAADQPVPVRREVLDLLRDPPECLYLFEGIRCYTEKRFEDPIAPACAVLREEIAARADLTVTPIFQGAVPNRVYDHEMSIGLGSKVLPVDALGYFGEPVLESIPIKLYRVERVERLTAG